MSTIDVNLSVQLCLSEETKLFFTNLLGGRAVAQTTPTAQAVPAAQAKPAKPAKPAKQAKPAEPAPAAELAPAEPAEPSQTSAATYSIEDVRRLLLQKVNGHRDVIKKKLETLGAVSVTTLHESKYSEFVDYLNSL